nr:membrane integrity-associated transporter subunit PqiC [Izhakiella capsodis]
MKCLPVLLVTLILSACGNSLSPAYYQIPLTVSPVSAQLQNTTGASPALWVDRVTMPDYLSGNGVVYQTSSVKYVIAVSHLWASPLDQQLKQALVSNLSAQLPGRVISALPLGTRPDTLSVNVTGFQGRYDGKVIVSGDWVLQQGDQIERRGFDLVLPQHHDGYDALVKTLGQGWQEVSVQISRQLSQSSVNK